MASRTGIPTVIRIARAFCTTLSRLKPAIVRATNNDENIVLAIDAALAACAALELILDPELEQGV